MDAPLCGFKVGDRVVKDPKTWEPSDFDSWGAGEGVGVVVAVEAGCVDVRWPAGRAFQKATELLPAPPSGGPEE